MRAVILHQKNQYDMQTIPVFFSIDDAYAPFLAVALASIKENASPRYAYHIHILNDNLSEESRSRLKPLEESNFTLEFVSLTDRLSRFMADSRLRNHRFQAFSSLSIYFRLFIPELFPQYDKGIYLDADIVVPGDISRLWEEPLGNNLIGACADYSIQHIAPFMRYIDQYVGVDHRNYVNSGVLLMNLKRLRQLDMAGRFLQWMRRYNFATVAPDQDYLNALCWGAIHYLDPNWDAMPNERIRSFDNPQIIHFNLGAKPWLNESVPYDDVFWKYAAQSGFEAEIRARCTAFLQDPEAVARYQGGIDGLIRMAVELTTRRTSFRSIITTRKEFRLCC